MASIATNTFAGKASPSPVFAANTIDIYLLNLFNIVLLRRYSAALCSCRQ